MKKLYKLFDVIAIIGVLGFLVACDDGSNDTYVGIRTLSGDISIYPFDNVTVGTQLTANYSGNETVTYLWKRGENNVGTNAATYTPSETGSYTVTVSAEGYYSKTSEAVIVTNAVNPNLPDLPGTITISPSENVTTGTELTAEYSGSETVTYQWYKDGAAISGAGGNKYTPPTTGNYTVTVNAVGYKSKTSDAVIVTGASLPDLPGNVTISPTDNVYAGTELTANYSETVTVTYQWNKDGTPVSGAGGNKYTPDEAGSYTVTASATGYNSKTSEAVIAATKGLTFTLISNGTAYSVSRGTVTDAEVVIPSEYKGLPVTTIADYGFSSYTNLTNITIPDSVTSIGYSAFSGCSGLTSITIPFVGAALNQTANTHFGYIFGAPFSSSDSYIPESLKTVIITGGNSIGQQAFASCSGLTSVTIGNNVTSIGDWAFKDCSGLTNVTIGNSVTSIGEYAFYICRSLTNVTIPNSVTSIGKAAFSVCNSLTSITIPNSVTSIDEYTFSSCYGLTSVTIPNSVTSIGGYAFYMCSGLTSITIPDSVTSIDDRAFFGCSGLTSVTFQGTISSVNFNSSAFGSYGYDGYIGDLRSKFYATNSTNGTPGTYTRASGSSYTWTNENIDPADPVPADYDISGIGTFTYNGSAKTVTITAKSGKSTGDVTVKYNGSTTAPSAIGTYTVTFDVAAATGWNAVSGLSAGTLTIVDATTTPIVVNIAAIQGVTAPATGGTPKTAITDSTQYSGTITWSPSHTTFAASTTYTATITLTAKSGYTLTGVSSNFFTVAGASSVSNSANSGVVTAKFPSTAAATLPALTGTVSITGTAQVGQTLSAVTTNLNGSGDISYQWKRGSTNIGTNSSTYTVQSTDSGYTITVTVTRSGNSGSITSSATAAITLPALTGSVSITGTVQVGQKLTADTTNLDGSGTISYQWKRGGTAISGATSSTYTVQSADVSNTITVTVTRSGYSGSVTSTPVSTVIVLPFSTTVEGSITATNTANRYSITLAQQGTITLSLTVPTDNTKLPNNGADVKWYYSSNTQISGGTSSGISFPYTETMNNLATGTYYIEIIGRTGVGNTGKFNIRVDYSKSEIEPNNTTANAQLLVSGLTVSASLSSSDTVDMFKYVLTEPGRLTVNVVKGTVDAVSYIYVRRYDTAGTRIRNDSVSSSVYWPYNEYMDLETGTYYIGIEQYSSSTGSYNLRADFTAAGNNETEPNNERVTAQVLTSGQTVKGLISYKDDIDMYKVVLSQPGRVTANVTKDNISYIYVRWYDAAGTRIRNDSVSSSVYWPYNEYMDLETGTYYIGIEQYSSSTGSYYLRADFTAAGNNETEPNNERVTAQVLTSDQTVKGFISYQDGTDMYRIVITQSKKVTVNVTRDSISSIYVRWYDADGTRIRNDSVSSSVYWPYNQSVDLAAGIYYISIEQYGSNGGTYNLKVTW